MMLSSYMQSTTYDSGKVAQTYILASKVKAKLTKEAVKNDVDLHRLVCQANLLDNLIDDLNHFESGSSEKGFSYDTINPNTYPLLDHLSLNFNASSMIDAHTYDDDFDDSDSASDTESEDENSSEDEVEVVNEHIIDCELELDAYADETAHIHNSSPNVYYTSDDSEFESDHEEESDLHSSQSIHQYHIAHEKLTMGLQRLNIESTLTDADYVASQTTITYNDGESDSDSESGSESDSEAESDNEGDAPIASNGDLYSLIRMHSHSTSLNVDTYKLDDEETYEDLHEEASAMVSQKSSESSELPSLSNCSSLSSMEDLIPAEADIGPSLTETEFQGKLIGETDQIPSSSSPPSEIPIFS